MNTIVADIHFEREKNVKALTYTLLILSAIFLFFFFTRWSQPTITPPPIDEGIEVNLGNSETGFGDIPPAAEGELSQESTQSPPSTIQEQTTPTQQIDEKGDEAIAAPITKPVVKPVTKPVIATPKNIVKPITKPIIKEPTPTTPKPKAVFSGGTKNTSGGNNSDSYNGVKNQGIAGGKGDQGNPNGNPNSDSYTGNSASGNSGIKIKSGLSGRHIAVFPRFQDDFNENAKVAIDVIVDANGKVISANVNPRGTTTTNANIRQIAKTKALLVKFNSGNAEQSGTLVFDFRVTN